MIARRNKKEPGKFLDLIISFQIVQEILNVKEMDVFAISGSIYVLNLYLGPDLNFSGVMG